MAVPVVQLGPALAPCSCAFSCSCGRLRGCSQCVCIASHYFSAQAARLGPAQCCCMGVICMNVLGLRSLRPLHSTRTISLIACPAQLYRPGAIWCSCKRILITPFPSRALGLLQLLLPKLHSHSKFLVVFFLTSSVVLRYI